MTVFTQKQIEGLVLIRDGVAMIADGLQKILETTAPKDIPKLTVEEINSLKTQDKTSDKGPYQLITKAENSGNPVFKMLQSYLEQHKGYAILHGLKIWSFDNPDKIGYRKQ